MKVRNVFIGLALVICTAAITSKVVSDDKDKKPAPPANDPKMQAMIKYGTPGENHKKLEPLVGHWTCAGKMWDAPDQTPTEITATADYEWALGNRFLMSHVQGGAMPGMPAFEGMGVMGYDNFRQQYVTGWVDNMNTAVFTSTGKVDATGKVFTFTGKADDASTGKKDQTFRSVMTLNSNDKITEEMYGPGPDGKEFKAMEIVYTRAK